MCSSDLLSDRQVVAMAIEAEGAERDLGTWQRVADSESPGAIEEAAFQGLWLQPAAKGAGSVLAGIRLLEAALQTVNAVTKEPQMPSLYFFEGACPILWEELEGMRWAEDRPGKEPAPAPGPDHGPDALRYILQLRQSLGFR